MYRKNSHRVQKTVKSASLVKAKQIYSSNKSIKSIKRFPDEKDHLKKNYDSIHIPKSKKVNAQQKIRPKASSQCDKGKKTVKPVQIQTEKMEQAKNFKSIDCESTAEDLIQKVNAKLGKQKYERCKIKSSILAKAMKNYKKAQLKEEQLQTINYSNVQIQNLQPQRKVFQCKIIKSAKIPFPLLSKSSQKRRKFQSLVANTDNISQIKIQQPIIDFASPESQYLIDF